ncbi:hypothetical protein GCM10010329_33520 [Streptomyces spiroverticillatus]|uniref:Uncharacterized protein n=1 Tax=Streptomyces finlayi TaxID=67296 RepID=A0A918WWJ8_9ACTN|nr:hypothetical protein GCM10010329_33520 [Streptomyces spiroverticillatus]GHC91156.1 hypothetical protein GCM10010334_25930 [Streptomyces finlayi]
MFLVVAAPAGSTVTAAGGPSAPDGPAEVSPVGVGGVPGRPDARTEDDADVPTGGGVGRTVR